MTSTTIAPKLVPTRMLNEYAYCPWLAYLEWVQGEFADSVDTVEGRFQHRRVDRPSGTLPVRSAGDAAGPKRLARTYKKMNGFGEPAQYSVFVCDLSPKERVLLEEALTEILNLKEDRVLIVDMGPSEGRGGESYTVLGNARELPGRKAVIV